MQFTSEIDRDIERKIEILKERYIAKKKDRNIEKERKVEREIIFGMK